MCLSHVLDTGRPYVVVHVLEGLISVWTPRSTIAQIFVAFIKIGLSEEIGTRRELLCSVGSVTSKFFHLS